MKIGETLYMQDFDEYQIQLFKEFEEFRPPYVGPTYPPYHKGAYLEEYFFRDFLNMGRSTTQYLIPVFWTNCYLSGTTEGLQDKLNKLDPEREYFCVSQHDDAVKEDLPIKTLHFNAGGNKDGIPIPLVCSPIWQPQREKTTFCSFVGSMTHPIRAKMENELRGRAGFQFYSKGWTPEISTTGRDLFLKKTAESMFSLCPRGYGATSFRFYEALQLGAVPIFIFNKPWFPFEDVVDWEDFSIRVHESKIKHIPDILVEFAPFADKMAKAGQEAYYKFFSLEATTNQIIRILNA